jgi:hypothetical protein
MLNSEHRQHRTSSPWLELGDGAPHARAAPTGPSPEAALMFWDDLLGAIETTLNPPDGPCAASSLHECTQALRLMHTMLAEERCRVRELEAEVVETRAALEQARALQA